MMSSSPEVRFVGVVVLIVFVHDPTGDAREVCSLDYGRISFGAIWEQV